MSQRKSYRSALDSDPNVKCLKEAADFSVYVRIDPDESKPFFKRRYCFLRAVHTTFQKLPWTPENLMRLCEENGCFHQVRKPGSKIPLFDKVYHLRMYGAPKEAELTEQEIRERLGQYRPERKPEVWMPR